MQINRPVIKQNSKSLMNETKPSPVVVGLVYYVIIMVLEFLSQKLDGSYDYVMNVMGGMMRSGFTMNVIPEAPHVTWYVSLVCLLIYIVYFMLTVGFTIYCYNVVKKSSPDFGNLFDGFAAFFRFLWLGILMFIFVFLWTLLLVIPGIVAAYRYRQAYYIMIDHPEMSALECITASKNMMKGHKWELFVMDLSYLGWYILCAIPFVGIWVLPYTNIGYSLYYVALRDIDKQPGAQDAAPEV